MEDIIEGNLLLGWFVSLEIECELGSIAAGDVN
jgi:hypothetical protein